MRIGIGYDIHRFSQEGQLVLGGVMFPELPGLIGHSDADVLMHAIIDAIFGAAGVGDIGQHFPPDDPGYAGANSADLLAACLLIIKEKGFKVDSLDTTVIAEHPKLGPRVHEVREAIASVLGATVGHVNVKATTNEGIGAIGRGEGIAAMAVALLSESH
ncbi:MAG: 2-C-methyl-D-erythritol 2,4-cyclodiphosphate synthase [Chloroflexi bacterium]|nr:2-C-methyl-D-erythritol 2,4-cyclodiphosphate synthase [Chloroflexota bacterium]